jgi:Rrf2 family protein
MRLSLTKRGEYAVRMAVHLATLPPDARVTAGDLGAACTIPRGNVPTIVNLLSRAGVLDCSPGRGGGCLLSRPAADISVLEVIEAVEGPLGARCVLDAQRCGVPGQECALHAAWASGRDAVLATFGALTLADAARSGAAVADSPRRRRR